MKTLDIFILPCSFSPPIDPLTPSITSDELEFESSVTCSGSRCSSVCVAASGANFAASSRLDSHLATRYSCGLSNELHD
ncbi:hypothetical protein Hdeb2414_s0010g00338971 [Helianthus debilis subsp. tardiflorus]